MGGEQTPTFEIRRDSRHRLQADVADDLTVGIKVLAETEERRILHGVHAYAVMDVRTSKGLLRVRDIRIKWSVSNEVYYIQWRQWYTGKIKGRDRFGEPRKEFLDVCGPLDPQTRKRFNDCIVAVFNQVKLEARLGTLGSSPSGAKLAQLRQELAAANAAEEDAEDDTIGDIAADAADAALTSLATSKPE